MKSKFYFLAVAVIMVAVFSGCKEKPEEIWLNEGSVTTDVASDVTLSSAKLQGAVYPLEVEVTERGFYYDTTREMYSLQKIVATDGFSSVVTSLESNTTYYYYAYATAYGKAKEGDVMMFKTLSPTAPTVETLESVGSTIKGNVTSDGGSPVIARGFMYGQNQNSLLQNVSCGNGCGNFSYTLTDLTNGDTYYYRAYAVNSVDTTFGELKSFVEGKISGHEYVDLGLPSGTLWATCNVGASSPEDYGIRYSAGTSVTWGSNWKTPTKAELEELIGACSYQWTTKNGIRGWRFNGTNGKSLFLPAAGNQYGNEGSCGEYLSSTWSRNQYYYYLWFSDSGMDVLGITAFGNIRPCCPR